MWLANLVDRRVCDQRHRKGLSRKASYVSAGPVIHS